MEALLTKLIALLKQLLATMEEKPEVFLPPVKTPDETNREKLYRIAYNSLGIDMAPLNDQFGCAEALSHVMIKAGVYDLHKPMVSTAELNQWLKDHLETVLEPLPGDVVMSATGSGNGIVRGHCGIVGRNSIMSNNSQSGKWDTQWVLKDWIAYYEKKGSIPTHYYRWV